MRYKKWVACLLAATILLSLTACKSNTPSSEDNSEKLTVYLMTETVCGNSKTVYAYDINGNILQQIDYWGEAIDWRIEYTCDDNGNRISAVGSDGTGEDYHYEYQYDSAGNMLEEIVSLDNIMVSYTAFTYDENGNRILAESSDVSKEYTYNEFGDLILVVESRNEEESARMTYEYDENGTLTQIVREAGIASSYSIDLEYDENGCLTKSITNWGGGTTEYTYKYTAVQITLERAKKLQSELGQLNVIIMK